MSAKKTDVFLSHNWGPDSLSRDNHHRVSVINEALKGAGYETWFDNDRMHGNIPQQMAEGIDNTKIVLIFITQTYRDKVSDAMENFLSPAFRFIYLSLSIHPLLGFVVL